MPEARVPVVIGIASGKGGVGKTTIAVNLSLALAEQGMRTLLLDADLGLANAQLALGLRAPWNIGHVLAGEKSLEEVAVAASNNLKVIPGASGVRELASLDEGQIAALIRVFDDYREPLDAMVVDIAPGLSPAVVTFLGACHRRCVVVCDHPASVADAYGLIKILAKEEGLDEIYVVPNMVEHAAHAHLVHTHLNDVTRRFLGASVGELPGIVKDEMVPQSWEKYSPVLKTAPGSAATRSFRDLARALVELPPVAPASGRLQFLANRMFPARTN